MNTLQIIEFGLEKEETMYLELKGFLVKLSKESLL